MTTATLEAPEVGADTSDEFFARQAQIDAAVRRKAARQHTAGDVQVLAMHGIEGKAFEDEAHRLRAIEERRQQAGTADEYAASVKLAEKTSKAASATETKLAPQIEKLEAELADMRGQLRKAQADADEAAAALAKRDHARELLRGRLLPASFKEMLAVMARPVREQFAADLAAARKEVARISGKINTGQGSAGPSSLADAERRLADLEKQLEAAVMQVGEDIRGFYLD